MATILRNWSYQYPWFNHTISRLPAVRVGEKTPFFQLPLKRFEIKTLLAEVDKGVHGKGERLKPLLVWLDF
ncbi:hypothetical protein [Gloeothece citriformis]|uniref:hypothetical protein n=1 Tax=Gloeothece citriformis TaxID=2546356 RepID=UPI0002E0A8D6|nr:hypothetical protein [Gloeothece citriformis]